MEIKRLEVEIKRQGRLLERTHETYKLQYARLVKFETERSRLLEELGDVNHA
ncbi:hypothetical protein ACFWPU_00905 [Streptomyces sp. NPDC058471]|uniref:hypothetical protein n=1 Tax=Streptomyces sp. NPDC058471 TaxID=3346516 RepID=UPI00365DDF39